MTADELSSGMILKCYWDKAPLNDQRKRMIEIREGGRLYFQVYKRRHAITRLTLESDFHLIDKLTSLWGHGKGKVDCRVVPS